MASSSASYIQKISDKLDKTSKDLDNLQQLIDKILSFSYQKGADELDPKEFLELHTRLMYALQSNTFLLCSLQGKELPEEFSKVEAYFKRIAKLDMNNISETPTTRVNKEALNRIVKHNT